MDRLSKTALNVIEENDALYLSVASLREIAIKQSKHRLDINCSISEIAHICEEQRISLLPIEPKHLDQIKNLNPIHGDPFDRLIVSQAIVENMVLVSRDGNIGKYDHVTVLW